MTETKNASKTSKTKIEREHQTTCPKNEMVLAGAVIEAAQIKLEKSLDLVVKPKHLIM